MRTPLLLFSATAVLAIVVGSVILRVVLPLLHSIQGALAHLP